MTSAGGVGVAGLTSLIRKVGVSKRKAFLALLEMFFLFFYLCLQAVNAKKQKARHCVQGFSFVGVAGFEPTTSSSRTKRATGLRYTPILIAESAAQNFQAANL